MHVRRWCIEWKILCSHNKAMARNRFISWKCSVHAAMYSFSVNRTESKLLIFFPSFLFTRLMLFYQQVHLVPAHTHVQWKSNSHSTSVSQFQLSSIVLFILSPLWGFWDRFVMWIMNLEFFYEFLSFFRNFNALNIWVFKNR